MLKLTVALFCGFIFALGLGISGMTQPQKVIGFLDIFGVWNPALAFVMIGAIGVHALSYFFIKKKEKPVLDSEFHLPSAKTVDAHLLLGSVLFGIGWGLGGFCPGPAITSLLSGSAVVLFFVLSMILGMFLFKVLQLKGVIK